jgi:integrase/recombinase XerD
MTIEDFLASHPYAKTTRNGYRYVLNLFASECADIAGLSPAGLLAFIESRGWGNSMSRSSLYAIKKYLRWKFGEDHPALAVRIKRTRPGPQRTLSLAQLLQLLASFNPFAPKGARDLAICALAVDTGLRLAELCRLRLQDLNSEDNSLSVQVKGGNVETAIYSDETAAIIGNWLNLKAKESEPYLFVNLYTGKGLTPNGMAPTIRRWGKAIGVKLSAHDFRRTFATITLANGAPSRIVQLAGRWSDIAMVERYSRMLEQRNIQKYLPMSKILRLDS